jgi:hypothetical protein
MFGVLFLTDNVVFTKKGWATFWAIFSKTYQVTLARRLKQKQKKISFEF